MTVIGSSQEGHFNDVFRVKAIVIELPLSMTDKRLCPTDWYAHLSLLNIDFVVLINHTEFRRDDAFL